jgi:integrase
VAVSSVKVRRVPVRSGTPRIYQRGASWYADIWLGDRRTRRSLGPCEDRAQAREAANALQDRLSRAAPVVAKHSFHAALLAWMRADTRGDTDLSILKIIQEKYHDRPIAEVTDDSLKQALAHLSASNWNRYRSTIRAALKLYAASHKTPTPPIAKRRAPQGIPRFLSRAEWERLRAKLPQHLITPADFALATGLRQANLFGLTWDRVNFTNKTVTVPATHTKAAKMLHLPLSPEAITILERVKGQHERHVFTFDGEPMASPKTAFKAALKRAKVHRFTWHGFRHTWASWHVLAGTPLRVLKDLGGWASIEMVEIYAHLQPSHLAHFAQNVVVNNVAVPPSVPPTDAVSLDEPRNEAHEQR